MKCGVKSFVTACCICGFWAAEATAVPMLMEMQVVSVNGGDVAPTDEITLSPGDTFEVEFFGSNWAPESIFVYQLRTDGSTMANAPGSFIDLAAVPCTVDEDCTSGGCVEGFCDNCLESISTDTLRPDYIFFKRAVIAAGSCAPFTPPLSYANGSLLFGMPGEDDPRVPRYLGTMLFQLSEGACGTFNVGILDNPDETFARSATDEIPVDVSAAILTVHSTTVECPVGCDEIVGSAPPHCSIDARQPHDLNDADATVGWSSIDLTLNCDDASSLTAAEFTLVEPGLFVDTPIGIDLVEWLGAGDVRIHFAREMEPGEWFCANRDVAPDFQRICLGYLPADVNQDQTSAPADILGVIDCLNEVAGFDCNLFNTDVDRSAEAGPPDILRVIDLLNGASEFEVFLDATLPNLVDCP